MHRLLLILHALCAMALLGATTHAAWVGVLLLRDRLHLRRLARVYSRLIGWLMIATFGLGVIMYPNYRYAIRGLVLDRYHPWASNLFDFKETLAAFALPLGLSLLFIGRHVSGLEHRESRALFAFLAISSWLLVAAAVVMGLVVTSVRGG